MQQKQYDVMIIGAGAAGLMCGIEAARRGRKTIILEHSAKPCEKIRISGGGKCNFTHLDAGPNNFLSNNPHFCISALLRFTPQDFLNRVTAYGIEYFEKTKGQLFCTTSANAIIEMLLKDFHDAGGELVLNSSIDKVAKNANSFSINTTTGTYICNSLVIATGGLSIPKMGATGFAYDIARQFGHSIITPRAGLVPFTLGGEKSLAELAGVSLSAKVSFGKTSFQDGFLFTHRGLSGPAILQISSYWVAGQSIEINLCPHENVFEYLVKARKDNPKQTILTCLQTLLPRRVCETWLNRLGINHAQKIADLPNTKLKELQQAINHFSIIPDGTEGYRTAEVTIGGINTDELSSQTMQSKICEGLYFIGEALDVTGWLGGYNFQWAWSSGWAAGQKV